MKTNHLPVIFRFFQGELVALFPTQKWNVRGDITCYAHTGQHGAASPSLLHLGRPAKPDEYAALLAELHGIYQDGNGEPMPLKVYKRATGKASLR